MSKEKLPTLKETATKIVKSFVNDVNLKTKEFTAEIDTSTPRIQSSVFDQYFRPRIEEYLFNGRDVVHEKYPERSLVAEWTTVTGSPNSEPKVVIGEGNNQQVMVVLPPLLPTNNVVAAGNPQTINNIYGQFEATKNTDPRAHDKLVRAVTNIGKITKFDTKEEHLKKWKQALATYDENKSKTMKKDVTSTKTTKSKPKASMDGMIL